jgi:hypothetical protein
MARLRSKRKGGLPNLSQCNFLHHHHRQLDIIALGQSADRL